MAMLLDCIGSQEIFAEQLSILLVSPPVSHKFHTQELFDFLMSTVYQYPITDLIDTITSKLMSRLSLMLHDAKTIQNQAVDASISIILQLLKIAKSDDPNRIACRSAVYLSVTNICWCMLHNMSFINSESSKREDKQISSEPKSAYSRWINAFHIYVLRYLISLKTKESGETLSNVCTHLLSNNGVRKLKLRVNLSGDVENCGILEVEILTMAVLEYPSEVVPSLLYTFQILHHLLAEPNDSVSDIAILLKVCPTF